jgi:hypothetical protein
MTGKDEATAHRALLKKLEADLGLYILTVGVVFAVYPAALGAEVYEPMRAIFAVTTWGTLLILAGFLHMAAAWWNGRNRWISLPVRLIAIAWHVALMAFLIFLFASAGTAPWPCITFILLSKWLLKIGSAARLDFADLIRQRWPSDELH